MESQVRRHHLAALEPDVTAVGREIGKGWMWSTAWAGGIGVAAGWLVFMAIDRMTGGHLWIVFLNSLIDLTSLAGNMVAGLVVGVILGLIQGRRLKGYIPTLAERWWVVATALAGSIGGLIVWLPTSGFVFYLNSILNIAPYSGAIITYASLGILFGVAQWLVLHSYLPDSGWWIVACLGGAVGGAIVTLLALISPLSVVIVGYYYCLNIPFNLMVGLSGFMPGGAATGYVLARSLYKSDRSSSLLWRRI